MYQTPPQYPNQPSSPNIPPYQYPQPPPMYQQPMPPQRSRKPRRWPWIVALILTALFSYTVGATSHSGTDTTTTTAPVPTVAAAQPTTAMPTLAPTSKPAPALRWVTTHTFTGNGGKKTASFTAPADWKIVWSCTPTSFMGNSYNVIVSVNNASDGSSIDPAAVNTMCKAGNTGDSTEEHQGGNVFLDVNSEGDWKILVEEMK